MVHKDSRAAFELPCAAVNPAHQVLRLRQGGCKCWGGKRGRAGWGLGQQGSSIGDCGKRGRGSGLIWGCLEEGDAILGGPVLDNQHQACMCCLAVPLCSDTSESTH